MAVYTRFVKTAKRLIAKYGEQCEWIIPAPVAEDPDQPWVGVPSTPEVIPVRMAFFPAGNGLETIAKMMNKDVAIGGVLALMGAVNFQPSDAHTVRRKNGKLLTIQTIDEVNPNGESILFTIRCIEP